MRSKIESYINADGRQYNLIEAFGLANYYNVSERSLGASKSVSLSFMKELEVSGVVTILSVSISIVNNCIFARDVKIIGSLRDEDLFEDVVHEVTSFIDYVATKDGEELFTPVDNFLEDFIKSLVYLRGYVEK